MAALRQWVSVVVAAMGEVDALAAAIVTWSLRG